jgi:hypothetical protein
VRIARGLRSIRLARAIACREQELLAHSRREKRRLEPEVGSVHDHLEAKHIVAESSCTLDVADAEEYAGAVDLGGRDVWCHQLILSCGQTRSARRSRRKYRTVVKNAGR